METIPNEILKEILIFVTTDIKVDFLIELMTVNNLWNEMLNTFMFYIYYSDSWGCCRSAIVIRSNNLDGKLSWKRISNYIIIYMKNYSNDELRNAVYLHRKEQHYAFKKDIMRFAKETNTDISKMKFYYNVELYECFVDFYTKYDLVCDRQIFKKVKKQINYDSINLYVHYFFKLFEFYGHYELGRIDCNNYREEHCQYFEKFYDNIKENYEWPEVKFSLTNY